MAIRESLAQTQWFRLLAARLSQAGVRHVVISPGSRSTPLVCAFEQAADLQLTLCIDERAASFVALGLARATGAPCVLLCTSGTAASHYYPAVIEAAHSAIPLVVISADRPAELQANGASQTTDQTRLFGSHVRAFFDLGTPEARPPALVGMARKIAQGVALSQAPAPGPVHFNAQAFKPLEPVSSNSIDEAQWTEHVDQLIAQRSHRFHAGVCAPTDTAVLDLAQRWVQARRPVLFCGPTSCYRETSRLRSFARQSGWPVLAEITHPVRQTLEREHILLVDAFDLIARQAAPDLQPDLVVAMGATPTSSAWLNWLTHNTTASLDVLTPHGLVDPLNRATTVVQCDEEAVLQALEPELCSRVSATRRSEWKLWSEKWKVANTEAQRQVAQLLTAPSAAFMEAHVIAAVATHVRANDVVMLGNSLPIRLAETFFAPERPYRCVSQRGVSGIDGLIAGAVGANLGTNQRTWLLLGDVSAVHDLSSLRLLAELNRDVIVVILDNGGGRIFDSLPVAKQVTDMRPWTTPHATAFDAVASALGLANAKVETRRELDAVLAQVPNDKPFVVWAKVVPNGAELAYGRLSARATQGPV